MVQTLHNIIWWLYLNIWKYFSIKSSDTDCLYSKTSLWTTFSLTLQLSTKIFTKSPTDKQWQVFIHHCDWYFFFFFFFFIIIIIIKTLMNTLIHAKCFNVEKLADNLTTALLTM